MSAVRVVRRILARVELRDVCAMLGSKGRGMRKLVSNGSVSASVVGMGGGHGVFGGLREDSVSLRSGTARRDRTWKDVVISICGCSWIFNPAPIPAAMVMVMGNIMRRNGWGVWPWTGGRVSGLIRALFHPGSSRLNSVSLLTSLGCGYLWTDSLLNVDVVPDFTAGDV